MKNTDSDIIHAQHFLSPRESLVRGVRLLGLQLSVLIILTALFALFDLDRTIASLFYHPEDKWFLGGHPIWRVLYEYGTLPGMALAVVCLMGWLTSFFNRRLASWRPYFLLVVLTTVIACGLLVNMVFKSYWGRPRPNQTTELGGYYAYRHVFPPGIPGKGASFPSGHSAMGFSVLTLVFLRRRSKKIAYAGLATGLVLGGLLAAARMVKGAHFPTDIVWSLGFVTMTATTLYYCIQKIPARRPVPAPPLTPVKKIGLILIVFLAAILIAGIYMTRRPFYKTFEYQTTPATQISRIVIRMNADPEQLAILTENTDKATLRVHAHGFGWAYVDYEIKPDIQSLGNTLTFTLDIDARSYFAELDHGVEVILPTERKKDIVVDVLPLNDTP